MAVHYRSIVALSIDDGGSAQLLCLDWRLEWRLDWRLARLVSVEGVEPAVPADVAGPGQAPHQTGHLVAILLSS